MAKVVKIPNFCFSGTCQSGVVKTCYNVSLSISYHSVFQGGGPVVQRCWVNFQRRGVLLTSITVGQGPIVLAVGAGGVVWTFFSHLSILFSFSLSLGDGPI